MSSEELRNDMLYHAALSIAAEMLANRLITAQEYAEIDTIIAKKYGISSCSLYRGIDLIYMRFTGNMSHEVMRTCQDQ